MAANEPGVKEEAGEPVSVPGAGIQRILVVDDQDIIRELIQQQLAEDGHQVETAGSGQEALEKMASNEFDLIVTDQSMPGMTGEELAVVAKKRRPATSVILLTGFGGATAETHGTPPGVNLILGKPATAFDLRRAIVQVTA